MKSEDREYCVIVNDLKADPGTYGLRGKYQCTVSFHRRENGKTETIWTRRSGYIFPTSGHATLAAVKFMAREEIDLEYLDFDKCDPGV